MKVNTNIYDNPVISLPLYNATSYSNLPGDSSTIPLILAPEGLLRRKLIVI